MRKYEQSFNRSFAYFVNPWCLQSEKKKGAISVLFYKNHPRACEYCAWADKTARDTMLCYYHGPVAADHKCRRFRYDPYKRVPGRTMTVRPLVLRADDEPSDE